METVQPIRDKDMINKIKIELLNNGARDYMLFTVGINTGLRISDILRLKVKDIAGVSHIKMIEKKSKKPIRIPINDNLKNDLGKYTSNMNSDEYLFQSREGDNKPMTRVRAYQILNDVAGKFGLTEIGTHTLRKTFGYWHYQQNKDVGLLQQILNHSYPATTLRYIGINQDMIDKSIDNFYL